MQINPHPAIRPVPARKKRGSPSVTGAAKADFEKQIQATNAGHRHRQHEEQDEQDEPVSQDSEHQIDTTA